jgi:hypothetical protein
MKRKEEMVLALARNPNAQKRISKRHNRDYLFWRRNAFGIDFRRN